MAAEERDVKWILVISLILLFMFKVVLNYFPFRSYVQFSIWWYIDFINFFFIILTVMFATLNKVGFLDNELTYQIAVYSFIISMALIFIASLGLLPFTL